MSLNPDEEQRQRELNRIAFIKNQEADLAEWERRGLRSDVSESRSFWFGFMAGMLTMFLVITAIKMAVSQ